MCLHELVATLPVQFKRETVKVYQVMRMSLRREQDARRDMLQFQACGKNCRQLLSSDIFAMSSQLDR